MSLDSLQWPLERGLSRRCRKLLKKFVKRKRRRDWKRLGEDAPKQRIYNGYV